MQSENHLCWRFDVHVFSRLLELMNKTGSNTERGTNNYSNYKKTNQNDLNITIPSVHYLNDFILFTIRLNLKYTTCINWGICRMHWIVLFSLK